MKRLIPAIIGLAAACACTAPLQARGPQAAPRKAAAGASKADEKVFPTAVNWQLVELNGKSVDDAPFLRVDDTYRGAGYSGCNTFSAPLYPITGQRLAMGPIALTKKMCAPARMSLERTFLGTLHSGPTWDVVAGDLVVKMGPNILRFRRGI